MFYLCVYLICVCVCVPKFHPHNSKLNRNPRPSTRSSISWFVYYANFWARLLFFLFLGAALLFLISGPAPAHHTNIKLQNYHLCNSCGNTNKSQFYGAAFFRRFFFRLKSPSNSTLFHSSCKNCECVSRVSLGTVIFLSVAVITISAAGRFHSLCFLYVNKFFIQYYTIWCVPAEGAVPVGGAKWHIKNKMIILSLAPK